MKMTFYWTDTGGKTSLLKGWRGGDQKKSEKTLPYMGFKGS